jgi:hypothetical protein
MLVRAVGLRTDVRASLKRMGLFALKFINIRFPFCFKVSDELLETSGLGVRSLVSQWPTLKATTEAWSSLPGISSSMFRIILRLKRSSVFECVLVRYNSGSSRVFRLALNNELIGDI